MATAGQLRERVRFEAPGVDANGEATGEWVEICTVACRRVALRGSEPVMEQRLVGVQPFTLTVRASSDTRQIGPGCRAVNTRTKSAQIYQVAGVTPDESGAWLDVLVTWKVGQTDG